MATERIMVAAPIVATEPGQKYETLPSHMTIFPWFEIKSENWQRFDGLMREVVEETVQPTVQGGDPVLFGPDGSTPARLLNRATRSFNIIHGLDIHAGVYRAVRRYGENYDPSYIGLNWYPHISDSHDFALGEDEQVTFPQLAVFERASHIGARVVKAVYAWEPTLQHDEPASRLGITLQSTKELH